MGIPLSPRRRGERPDRVVPAARPAMAARRRARRGRQAATGRVGRHARIGLPGRASVGGKRVAAFGCRAGCRRFGYGSGMGKTRPVGRDHGRRQECRRQRDQAERPSEGAHALTRGQMARLSTRTAAVTEPAGRRPPRSGAVSAACQTPIAVAWQGGERGPFAEGERANYIRFLSARCPDHGPRAPRGDRR